MKNLKLIGIVALVWLGMHTVAFAASPELPPQPQACSAEKVVKSGQWHMLSVPCAPEGRTLKELFVTAKGLKAEAYGKKWIMYTFKDNAYEIPKLDQSPEVGRGYWFYQNTGSDVTLRMVGVQNADTLKLDITENNTWSMIGYPFHKAIKASYLSLYTQADNKPLSWEDAESKKIVSAKIWTMKEGKYQTIDMKDASITLNPWDAYWVRILDNFTDNPVDVGFKKADTRNPALTREALKALILAWAKNPSKTNADKIIHANTSKVTDMSELFDVRPYCSSSDYIPSDAWDIPAPDNPYETGEDDLIKCWNINHFNLDISKWDVSNVTNMSKMFYAAKSFNKPLEKWNVSNVTNMSKMFYFAEPFNQPLEKWDVSSVTDMSYMFRYALYFNQPLEKWDVSSVTDMVMMFATADDFNQSLNGWDISNVENMSGMLSNLDWSGVFDMKNISTWDLSDEEINELFEASR